MKKLFVATLLAVSVLAPSYHLAEAKKIYVPPRPHAICRDGTISYSVNRSGTCSHHRGVRNWLY